MITRGPVLLLGLSRENLDRLMDGQPIHVTPEKSLLPGGTSVVIVGGETEEAIMAELASRGLIGRGTDVRDHR